MKEVSRLERRMVVCGIGIVGSVSDLFDSRRRPTIAIVVYPASFLAFLADALQGQISHACNGHAVSTSCP